MTHLLSSIIFIISSFLGLRTHSDIQTTSTPISIQQNQQPTSTSDTEYVQGTSSIPSLLSDYNLLFEDGTSTDTSLSAIEYRLDNTYIHNKTTGKKISLSYGSPIYGNGNDLIQEDTVEVMAHTLYAGSSQLGYPGVNLWELSEGNSSPKLLYKNILWFAVSDYGFVALTDSTGRTLTILDAQGNVVHTLSFDQVNFCDADGSPGGAISEGGWSGHTIWVQCDSGIGTNPVYLQINADTLQVSIGSAPPPQAGII